MDVKGAVELARLLKERHGEDFDDTRREPTPAADGARPIYHWIGGSPPVAAVAPPEPERPSRRGRKAPGPS